MNIKEAVKGTKGKFFGVKFIKKDKTERHMLARLGVKAFLQGGKNKVEAIDRPYITVYDVTSKGYRTVNLDTVTELEIGGVSLKVI